MTPAELQRAEAREEANRIRLARVGRIRELEVGQRRAAPWVLTPPEELEAMFVFDFLRSVPYVGLSTIRVINKRAMHDHVNLATTLGKLHPKARRWLATCLGEHQDRFHMAVRRRNGVLRARPQG